MKKERIVNGMWRRKGPLFAFISFIFVLWLHTFCSFSVGKNKIKLPISYRNWFRIMISNCNRRQLIFSFLQRKSSIDLVHVSCFSVPTTRRLHAYRTIEPLFEALKFWEQNSSRSLISTNWNGYLRFTPVRAEM